MRLLVLGLLVCFALLGCNAEPPVKDAYLDAPSAPKGTDNSKQLQSQGMDPNTNMAGETK